MDRKRSLKCAEEIICYQKKEQYGEPENNFELISLLWSNYIGTIIDKKDVACMMCLFKIARIKTGIYMEDNFIDLIGYAACGNELCDCDI